MEQGTGIWRAASVLVIDPPGAHLCLYGAGHIQCTVPTVTVPRSPELRCESAPAACICHVCYPWLATALVHAIGAEGTCHVYLGQPPRHPDIRTLLGVAVGQDTGLAAAIGLPVRCAAGAGPDPAHLRQQDVHTVRGAAFGSGFGSSYFKLCQMPHVP